VFAETGEDIYREFGLIAPVQHVSHEKIIELLALLPEFSFCSGGGAANVAKIAAFLGLSAGFIGTVGPGKGDRFGDFFEKDLSRAGVIPILSQGKCPTGLCLMLQTTGGETRIAAAPSAALELTERDIPEEAIRQAKAAVLDGFMLGREGPVRRVLDLANRYGTVVALDAGSAGQVNARAAEIAAYCRNYPLILFMNEDEAAAFYKALNQAGEAPQEKPENQRMYDFFKKFTGGDLFPIVVVKLGPKGAVVFAGGAIYREETLPVIPLETTGAGDAFCAAFLTAWIRNKSLSECAALGNKAAALVLDVKGTQVDRKKFNRIAKLLKKKQGP
jgi:sugar/nucleoside kinase (ribokinase family)